jgi:hypothetical protein
MHACTYTFAYTLAQDDGADSDGEEGNDDAVMEADEEEEDDKAQSDQDNENDESEEEVRKYIQSQYSLMCTSKRKTSRAKTDVKVDTESVFTYMYVKAYLQS